MPTYPAIHVRSGVAAPHSVLPTMEGEWGRSTTQCPSDYGRGSLCSESPTESTEAHSKGWDVSRDDSIGGREALPVASEGHKHEKLPESRGGEL